MCIRDRYSAGYSNSEVRSIQRRTVSYNDRKVQIVQQLLLCIRSIQVTTIAYLNDAMRIGIATRSPDHKYSEDAFHRRTWSGLSQMPHHYLDAKKAAPLPKVTPVTSAPATKPDTTTNTKLSSRVDAPLVHQNGDWLAKFAASPSQSAR